jgi:(p)ppGpp synthase/HD superfamily hydrolase
MGHLTEVAGMVWGCFAVDDPMAETVVAAALLHDAIEDQSQKSPRELILAEGGQRVLELILECTEIGVEGIEKAPWHDRKVAYLSHIQELSVYALLISVCDKLQSARELKRQVKRLGNNAYDNFVKEVPLSERKDLVLWFHCELFNSYRTRLTVISKDMQRPIIDALWAYIEEFWDIVSWLEEPGDR